ncbi:MAG: PAS domain S-box protein [Ramlibacter sp.]|nr:PAS domain S-box protein [Ramlibacter sp.]
MSESPRSHEAMAADLLRYRTMVEHAAEGICVGQGGIIRFANARCLQVLGVTAAEASSRQMIEYVHPDDRMFVAAQRDRRSRGEKVPAFEARFRRDDGQVSWVEINGVVIDWEGKPANLFFLKDTTERHALDQALKSALAEREAILETTTVGVTFLVNRRHQWLNRTLARMLGYEPAELLGQETRIHYQNDEDYERIGGAAYGQIDLTGHYGAEVRMKRKDGSLVWVQIEGTPVTQGPLRGTVWTYVDVTQRKAAEHEMANALSRERELGELKTRLLSMASHEFRTPLAAILSSAELIGHYGDKIGEDEQRSIMDDLVAAARRMQLMLDDMLTLGQAEAGRLAFNPRPSDAEQVCRQVLAEARSAQVDGHVLNLEVAGGGTRNLDARLIHYILGNLVANACKYSPPGSEVRVRLDCENPGLRLDVIDQGMGIPEADLPHLFDSFHRGGNAGNRPGSGLGLAIVKRCVVLHGGQVSVVSKLGAGSHFTVTLPDAAPPRPPTPANP